MRTDPVTTAQVLAAVARWEAGEFCYGRHDCAQFAGAMARHLAAHDYLAPVRYADQATAEALIREHGSLAAVVTWAMRVDPRERAALRPGDVVLWRHDGSEGLGVALDPGAHRAVTVTTRGAVTEIPGRLVVQGWPI
jgi:hypothetical protein